MCSRAHARYVQQTVHPHVAAGPHWLLIIWWLCHGFLAQLWCHTCACLLRSPAFPNLKMIVAVVHKSFADGSSTQGPPAASLSPRQ